MPSTFLRPPGALPETEFLATCIRCGKCAQACPYKAITTASFLEGVAVMGTPIIRARRKPCYLCMKCPPVCPSGALRRNLKEKEQVRMGAAVVNRETCLAWQDTLCRSCFDDCPLIGEAIGLDADLRPVVDDGKCVGCGICESVCPVERAAIAVRPGARR